MYLCGNSIGTDDGRRTTDDRQHTLNLSFIDKPRWASPLRHFFVMFLVKGAGGGGNGSLVPKKISRSAGYGFTKKT